MEILFALAVCRYVLHGRWCSQTPRGLLPNHWPNGWRSECVRPSSWDSRSGKCLGEQSVLTLLRHTNTTACWQHFIWFDLIMGFSVCLLLIFHSLKRKSYKSPVYMYMSFLLIQYLSRADLKSFISNTLIDTDKHNNLVFTHMYAYDHTLVSVQHSMTWL